VFIIAALIIIAIIVVLDHVNIGWNE
jgi:hypothetical protein